MKKSLFLGLALLVLVFSGCKKNPLVVNFTISDSENFTIPPNSILTLPPIITPPFATNSWSGDYQNNNTDKNHVTQVKLHSLALTIISPSGKTFGFIKSIDVYLQAPNLPDIKIAYIENNPESAGSVINLTPVDVDISAYAKADSFTLSVQSTTQENNADNVDVRSDMTLDVTANVL